MNTVARCPLFYTIDASNCAIIDGLAAKYRRVGTMEISEAAGITRLDSLTSLLSTDIPGITSEFTNEDMVSWARSGGAGNSSGNSSVYDRLRSFLRGDAGATLVDYAGMRALGIPRAMARSVNDASSLAPTIEQREAAIFFAIYYRTLGDRSALDLIENLTRFHHRSRDRRERIEFEASRPKETGGHQTKELMNLFENVFSTGSLSTPTPTEAQTDSSDRASTAENRRVDGRQHRRIFVDGKTEEAREIAQRSYRNFLTNARTELAAAISDDVARKKLAESVVAPKLCSEAFLREVCYQILEADFATRSFIQATANFIDIATDRRAVADLKEKLEGRRLREDFFARVSNKRDLYALFLPRRFRIAVDSSAALDPLLNVLAGESPAIGRAIHDACEFSFLCRVDSTDRAIELIDARLNALRAVSLANRSRGDVMKYLATRCGCFVAILALTREFVAPVDVTLTVGSVDAFDGRKDRADPVAGRRLAINRVYLYRGEWISRDSSSGYRSSCPYALLSRLVLGTTKERELRESIVDEVQVDQTANEK